MQFVQGILLHKKQVPIKTGKRAGQDLPVVSVLDEYDGYSRVIDVTDFDNHINGIETGRHIEIPIRSTCGVSKKGNPYINYTVAGPVKEIQRAAE